jgi:hypothetical protein
LIFVRIAFSIIFEMWERTTIGLMSSNLTGPFVCVFYSGTSLPTLKYSGMIALLRASVISAITFSLNWLLFLNTFPSKQSGPKPLLKLLLFIASTTSSLVNGETLLALLVSTLISSSSSTLKSMFLCYSLLYSGLL